ncbi:MAG: AsmA family protein [Proteobacteria bacterium]|nr:AsmA family protein [Pseudomonadota bacterium]
MKKLGIALLALVVVLIAAILIGPSFVDWNAHKGRITAEVEKLTGRALTIEGDISLVLLPAPALSVDKVRLANVEGGSAPFMIELESLQVRIALVPLVQGQVQVESVVLVRPTILAEILEDGRRNWDIIKSDEPAPTGAPSRDAGDDDAGQVRLDSVQISDGTLVYRDATTGREERIEGLNAEIVAGSLKGPFAVSGDAVVRGVKTEFEVTVGRFVQGGATSLNLKLGLPDAGAKARFGGAISQHPDGMSLRGKIKADGENLASLMALLAGGGKVSGVLARPFDVETEVSADPRQVSATNLIFRFGETSIDGDLRVKLGPPIDARINISVSRLDLDKFLATDDAGTAGETAVAPAPGGQTGATAAPDRTAAALALPEDVTGTLEVNIDALVYRRQVVRQMLVSMALAEGRLKVSQALALLPGGSDVSLTGELASAKTAAGQELRFVGRLEAASDNLRGVFDWLGVDVTRVPAERLRRMSLSTRIDATARQANFSEIDLRVDVSRATGGIAVALRERPGFGIGLAIDKLNLDAYLPAAAAGGAPAGTGAGTVPQGAGQQGAGGAAGPQAEAGALAALAGFDANLDLKLGSLSLRGVIARNLHLDATLRQGAVTLREALIGDLAGSRLRLTGSVADLAVKPSVELDVELTVPDPGRLAKLANLDAKALSRIGAIELTGRIKGSLERMGFDVKLDALGGRFGFAGTAQPLAAPPGFDIEVAAKHASLAGLLRSFDTGLADTGLAVDPKLGGLDLSARVRGTPAKVQVADLSGTLGPARVSGGFDADLSGAKPVVSGADLAIEIKHPDLAGLLRALAPEAALGKGLGAVDVKARVTGGSDKVRISELAGRIGPVELSGGLGVDLSGPQPAVSDIDIAFALRHPNLAELARAVRPDMALGPALGGVDLKGRVTGDAKVFRVSDLAGRLGEADLSGSLGVDLSGPKPAIDVDLSTGELPLAALLAPAAAGGGKGATGGGAAPAGTTAKGGRRWSNEPIDVSALNQVNAEIKLTSKAWLLDKLRLDNAVIEASLVDGVLDLRKLNATVYGGALSVIGKVDARKTLEAGLAVTAIELDLARLLRDLAESDRVSGPLSVNASLSTRGRSEAELVSALTGKGDLEGTLKIKAKAEEKIGSALLGLAGQLLGQKVKELRNVTKITGATNVLFNAFADAPAAVSGTFTVERGVVRTTDLRVDGRQATALTAGSADLPNWRLDTRTDVYRAEDPNTPYLTLDLRGPLDAPNPRVRGAAFQPRQQRAPAPATGPQPSGTSQTEPAPEPPQTQPEDLFKKSLGKALKGLFGN